MNLTILLKKKKKTKNFLDLVVTEESILWMWAHLRSEEKKPWKETCAQTKLWSLTLWLLRSSSSLRPQILRLEVLWMGSTLKASWFHASHILGEGANLSFELSNIISCLYSSVAGLSARPGKKQNNNKKTTKTNLKSSPLLAQFQCKCKQFLNQSFALNKASYLFPLNSPPGFLTIV